MTLKQARKGREYTIQKINLVDREFERFLFTLGLFCGEKTRIVFRSRDGFIVAVRNSRYFIDTRLASAIII